MAFNDLIAMKTKGVIRTDKDIIESEISIVASVKSGVISIGNPMTDTSINLQIQEVMKALNMANEAYKASKEQ